MELKDIKELIALMRKNDLSVFKLEQEGFKITLKRGSDAVITTAIAPPAALPAAAASAPAALPVASVPAPAGNTKDITSPMVGTFYGAPAPDAQPFVKVGQEIQADTVVCIIEAMKVMNEIKAEVAGTVLEVIAESGKPVQFGQPMFRIKPR